MTGTATEKPRIRVPAGRAVADIARPRSHSGYLRDTRSGIIMARGATLTEHREQVRAVWRRAAALVGDIVQNSGRLRGAVDQVLADTVGEELVLTPKPKLAKLGYSDQETVEFVAMVKDWWKRRAWNPRECDFRGKFIMPQQVDMAIRSDIVFGEAIALLEYWPKALRRRYGVVSGTKVLMMSPATLVQDTNSLEGLYQGVIHDENGRPVTYRFRENRDGMIVKKDYRAFDREGRPNVVHVFDPAEPTDVRGISRLAAAMRRYLQHDTLVDTTIQMGILQTTMAFALTSPNPSKDAFEALAAIDDDDFSESYMDYFHGALERAEKSKISISGDPQISQLGPGEKLELLSTGVPGPQFLPVSAELSRDLARALGITYGGLTMDNTSATYSSVNMDNASIWPIVTRRRSRTAAPICQAYYEAGLDEEIGEGRIPFKGGYEAFNANREDVLWTLWNGPAKPTADDGKSAKAATERLINGTGTFEDECAARGFDPEEVFESRVRWHKRFVEAGLPSPFVAQNKGGGGGDAATEDTPPVKRQNA
ncbi:phage portal protein [Mesorhizobium sp. WSM4976]|uniref:phage portal protein n=1 Tax=Mesorhizobium sp. WSM4976 TaxID=3038549 RepID=UPI0024167360|nr:phage portal protein [Mesorhizobium sp. WSM4976]MDG4895569.1 phage portal protein [Mesorhizobium sp. WSM4976]